MAFTTDQQAWLTKIGAKGKEYISANEVLEQKAKKLEGISTRIEEMRDKMEEANAKLQAVFKDERTLKNFYKLSLEHSMDWKTGDRDVEIDTVHDLKGGKYKVDPNVLAQVQHYHRELVKIQKEMEEAEENGEKVFTAKDIERELWSPLVQADIIPSNAVADKYSQEAQVWNGACEIYQKMLEEHTEQTSKHERLRQVLRIGKDTLQMMGTIGMESMKAANFPDTFISQSDKAEDAKNSEKLKELKAAKPPTDPEKLSEHNKKIEDLTKKTEDFDKRVKESKKVAAKLARDQAILKLSLGVVDGGLGFADKRLKEKKQEGWAFAKDAYDFMETQVVNSFGLWVAQSAKDDPTRAGTQNFKTSVHIAKNCIEGGLKSGKLVFRLQEAYAANNKGDREKAIRAIVDTLADVVAMAFSAADQQYGKVTDGKGNVLTNDEGEDLYDSGDKGKWTMIGTSIKAGIKGAARIEAAAQRIAEDAAKGKRPTAGSIIGLLGITALEVTAIGTFQKLSDITRKDYKPDETHKSSLSAFTESVQDSSDTTGLEKEKESREAKFGTEIGGLVDKSEALNDFLGELPQNVDMRQMEKKIAEQLKKQEEEQIKQEMEDFKKKVGEDPELKKEVLANINTEVEAQVEALEKLIEDATPNPDELEDEAKKKRAMDSVDKLIKEAEACNTRWKVIIGMTNGGVGILVAALPVAGLAASLTRLATDVAILIRRSYHLNRWRKNLALTFNNSSVYGPAIQSRLESAIVQVSEQAARVIFDAIGVTADALKLADASGVGAAVGAAGHGIEIGNNMARALTEWGFKMQKEAHIEAGWQLYKRARANPGDRKMARTAMRWNSTLSKCVMAYGIVMDGDPIAKEVGRSCGLTPEILANQKDVCPKVVKYFETLYSDDPVVLRRIPLVKDWHPGSPTLAIENWARFKAAAYAKAKPPMAIASSNTPAIDKALAKLEPYIGKDANYSGMRDKDFPDDPLGENRSSEKYGEWLQAAKTAGQEVKKALEGFQPKNGPCPKKVDPRDAWTEGLQHKDMAEVSASLSAQVALVLGEISVDLKEYEAMTAEPEDLELDVLNEDEEQTEETN